jgi:hypoxanthine phosphoribosyltransferase
VTGVSPEAAGAPQPLGEPDVDAPAPDLEAPFASAVDATPFAHASEAEMARILDFYGVRWEYEPTTFPILWNLDGAVVESFAPDFYLPELEVFLEMTTLKQRLVRKKNRKLRRLRELYPDIRIKLFYARDFRAMMLKYGRLGLAESLSGTLGQVVPERPPVDLPAGLAPESLGALAAAERLAAVEVLAAPPEITGDDATLQLVGGDPPPSTGAAPTDRLLVPPVPRAKPRSRSGRRRRSAAVARQAGAEREAGA